MTSRADVDIQRMLVNQPETTGEHSRELRHPNRDSDLENLMKQESLQAWGQQAIASTADFVLGLMQNHRRGLFSWSVIAKGAIVFDEIHSYDAKMFGSLIRFLQTFPQAPALLMTASLQPSRRAALEAAGVDDYRLVRGDEAAEAVPRYCLKWCPGGDAVPAEYWNAVADEVANGGKVLWVCNTVKDAVEIYHEACTRLGSDQKRILFHSRFCYCHRVARQELVLRAFLPDRSGCLAVTTQGVRDVIGYQRRLDGYGARSVSGFDATARAAQPAAGAPRRGRLPHLRRRLPRWTTIPAGRLGNRAGGGAGAHG